MKTIESFEEFVGDAHIDEAGDGIIRDGERAVAGEARSHVVGAREAAKSAMAEATKTGSQRRPALYKRAIAALDQANELLDQARSANGR